MKKNSRVTGTPSARGCRPAAARRAAASSATVPESRPSAMRALGCGSAKPPPTGASVTPPLARSRWPSSLADGRRRAGQGGHDALEDVRHFRRRHVAPDAAGAQQRPEPQAGRRTRTSPARGSRPAPRARASAAHCATCARSNNSRPRSGVCGKPSSRIQPSTTFSETPNDSAIWMRFRYMVIARFAYSLPASEQHHDRQRRQADQQIQAGRTAPARAAGAAPPSRRA